MTDEKALLKLIAINDRNDDPDVRVDIERQHVEADDFLCSLLEAEYPKTVGFYHKMKKWYA